METKVAAVAPAPDPGRSPAQSGDRAAQRESQGATGPDPVEMRLVIEEDQASGSYVYKTIDRATGEVLQQLPRAEVLKLREDRKYAAGAIIRTEA
jgi:flagellar protein FlaG